MQKTAVVYATRNGSTRRYAEWIAGDCGADLIAVEQADIDDLVRYDTLVYGGCVYGGRIDGVSLIKNNRDLLEHTRLFVFTVGLTQPGDDAAFEQVLSRNFLEEERRGIQFFHFPGALDYQKLKLVQRPMLYLLKKSIQSKAEKNRTQLEKYLLESYGGKVDFTNQNYIGPLVQEILAGGRD